MSFKLLHLTLCSSVILFCSCNETERQPRNIEQQFRNFTERYNAEIKEWVQGEIKTTTKKLQTASLTEKPALEKSLTSLSDRENVPAFFAFKQETDLPPSLKWESGDEEPEIGDPNAVKGGVFRRYLIGYPSTFRSIGKNANNHFKSYLYNEVSMSLVGLHPVTGKLIPGEAQRWAVSPDGKTVYYHLNEDITYNTGESVKAWHYAFGLYIRLSDNIFYPTFKKYIKDRISNVTVYGDRYVSVTLSSGRPMMPYFAAILSPSSPEFYKYYGPDYEEYYDWKPEPTTGAYEIKAGNYVKGVSITQTRVENWWAKDRRYYKHRFNPNAIYWRTIREETKAFEYFKTGQLDYFAFGKVGPEYWYDKSETEQFHDGFIEKTAFYNNFPRDPRGLYLNVHHENLTDLNVRLGVSHSMNWKKVIEVIYRGDYEQLNQMFEGYGEFTNDHIKARKFNITKAREYFAKAGYTETNNDGLLTNKEGKVISFEITYASLSFLNDMMLIIQKEAKKTGLNVILRPLETTVFYRAATNKDYQSIFMSFGISPPFPSYYNYFHSFNAFDEKGNPKSSTNNMFLIADPEIDKRSIITRETGDLAEMISTGHEIQKLVHDAAIFIPAYKKPFRRVSYQRWVRWPDTDEITFNVPVVDEPHETHVYWIDQEIKNKTAEAKRAGDSFPEVVNIYDQYRTTEAEPNE